MWVWCVLDGYVSSGAAWTLLGTDLLVESMVQESMALGTILESMIPCKGTDTALCQLCHLLEELASLGLYYLKRLRTYVRTYVIIFGEVFVGEGEEPCSSSEAAISSS